MSKQKFLKIFFVILSVILISGACYKIWKMFKSSVNNSETSFKEKAQTKKIVIPSQLEPCEILVQIYGEDLPWPVVPIEAPDDVKIQDFLFARTAVFQAKKYNYKEKLNEGFLGACGGSYSSCGTDDVAVYFLSDGTKIEKKDLTLLSILIIKYKNETYALKDYQRISSLWKNSGYYLKELPEEPKEIEEEYQKIRQEIIKKIEENPERKKSFLGELPGILEKAKEGNKKGIKVVYRTVFEKTTKSEQPFVVYKDYLLLAGRFIVGIIGIEKTVNDTFDRIIKAFGNY